jgi:hypothetical protein
MNRKEKREADMNQVNIQTKVSEEEHMKYKTCAMLLSKILGRRVTLGDLIRISLNEKCSSLLQ